MAPCGWDTSTIVIQQHIFGFKISVDDSFLVEVLQTLDDLSDVETGPGLLKPRVVLIHQVDMIPSETRGQRSSNTTAYPLSFYTGIILVVEIFWGGGGICAAR